MSNSRSSSTLPSSTLLGHHRVPAPDPQTPAIAYDELGDGPTVVFLHGIGGNRSNWHKQLDALAKHGFRAVAWDARGYGNSDDYDGELDFGEFSSDLARLLDHLRCPSAHLVGLSMGGRILQDFYPRFTDRVQSLTLCCTFPEFDQSFTPQAREEFVRLRKEPLLAGKSPRDMAPAVARSLLGPNATEAHYEQLVQSMAQLHTASYIKTIEATTHYDQPVDLAGIVIPTLLIFAEHDRLTPPSVGKSMAEQIPDSHFEVVPDAGHLVNIEQPERFNDVLLGFLHAHS